jgi:hypothetical protein
MSVSKKLFIAAGTLAVIIVTGVIGYELIEGWSFMDSI